MREFWSTRSGLTTLHFSGMSFFAKGVSDVKIHSSTSDMETDMSQFVCHQFHLCSTENLKRARHDCCEKYG